MKNTTEENRVKLFLAEAGYSRAEIAKGMKYADKIGYDTIDEMGRLILSHVLYAEEQLKDGAMVGWEPMI